MDFNPNIYTIMNDLFKKMKESIIGKIINSSNLVSINDIKDNLMIKENVIIDYVNDKVKGD